MCNPSTYRGKGYWEAARQNQRTVTLIFKKVLRTVTLPGVSKFGGHSSPLTACSWLLSPYAKKCHRTLGKRALITVYFFWNQETWNSTGLWTNEQRHQLAGLSCDWNYMLPRSNGICSRSDPIAAFSLSKKGSLSLVWSLEPVSWIWKGSLRWSWNKSKYILLKSYILFVLAVKDLVIPSHWPFWFQQASYFYMHISICKHIHMLHSRVSLRAHLPPL